MKKFILFLVLAVFLSSPSMAQRRKNVRKEAWYYQGQGAQKTVDWILNKTKKENV